MAIVINTVNGDQSTYEVCRWLQHFNEEVFILDETTNIKINSIELATSNHFIFDYEGDLINSEHVSAFWHRRGNIKIDFSEIDYPNEFPFRKEFEEHLENEQRKVKQFLQFLFKKKRNLGNIFLSDINKLYVLRYAAEIGIIIPATLVTSSKNELLKFKNKSKDLICKPVSEGIMCHNDDALLLCYTSVVTDDTISKLPDNFHFSLFQEKIEKKFELRIFYLDEEFYTMAIFSQNDSQTAVDFRKYNRIKPNRTVPFNLPEEIKNKLRSLMQTLNLNTGSIDMAVSKKNEYIFFEVNPIGQFGMTSSPCNYYIEKRIAQYLLEDYG